MVTPSVCARKIIHLSLGLLCLSSLLARETPEPSSLNPTESHSVSFGIIADVHYELQKDADKRLKTFIQEANQRKNLDFIIQLGDLSHGGDGAIEKAMKTWESFPKDRYHVLGNHDTDKTTKADVLKRQKMDRPYYSFDKGDYRFIILDSVSDKEKDKMGAEQLKWLEKEIEDSTHPCILFSHAGFDDIWVTDTSYNKKEVRKIVKEANEKSKTGKKVIAFFCGHHHLDEHSISDNISFFQINSASYYWIPGATTFSNGNMAEYKHPLFAFVTLDPKKKTITIEGKKSIFLPPAPTKKTYEHSDKISSKISDRKIRY